MLVFIKVMHFVVAGKTNVSKLFEILRGQAFSGSDLSCHGKGNAGFLAFRTIGRPPSPKPSFLDSEDMAAEALFPFAAIDLKEVLHIAMDAFAGPVGPDGRSVVANGQIEDTAAFVQQGLCLPPGDSGTRAEGGDSACEEDFVGIDVSQSGKYGLVHQELFYRLAAFMDSVIERLGIRLEGFFPEPN